MKKRRKTNGFAIFMILFLGALAYQMFILDIPEAEKAEVSNGDISENDNINIEEEEMSGEIIDEEGSTDEDIDNGEIIDDGLANEELEVNEPTDEDSLIVNNVNGDIICRTVGEILYENELGLSFDAEDSLASIEFYKKTFNYEGDPLIRNSNFLLYPGVTGTSTLDGENVLDSYVFDFLIYDYNMELVVDEGENIIFDFSSLNKNEVISYFESQDMMCVSSN